MLQAIEITGKTSGNKVVEKAVAVPPAPAPQSSISSSTAPVLRVRLPFQTSELSGLSGAGAQGFPRFGERHA